MSFYAKDQAWCRANIVTIEPTRVYVSEPGYGVGYKPGQEVVSFYAKAWCRASIVTIEPTRVM